MLTAPTLVIVVKITSAILRFLEAVAKKGRPSAPQVAKLNPTPGQIINYFNKITDNSASVLSAASPHRPTAVTATRRPVVPISPARKMGSATDLSVTKRGGAGAGNDAILSRIGIC